MTTRRTILNPDRVREDAVRAARHDVHGDKDPVALIETLQTRELLPADWDRDARVRVEPCRSCKGYGYAGYSANGERVECGACSGHGCQRLDGYPLDLALEQASCWPSVATAEALAREVAQRFARSGAVVAWELVTIPWMFLRRPNGEAPPGPVLSPKMRGSQAYRVGAERARARADFEGFSEKRAGECLVAAGYIADFAARDVWTLTHGKKAANPWDPVCAIWDLGFGFGQITDDLIVLAMPRASWLTATGWLPVGAGRWSDEKTEA